MKFSDVIQPGDKIDIRLVEEIEEEKKSGKSARIYKSQVLDTGEAGEFEISIPIENSRLVLLPLGVRFEFVFYSKGNLYTAFGQVVERYKKDNIFALKIELKSVPEKYQRREFFRHYCTLDCNYYEITPKQAEMQDSNEILAALQEFEELPLQEKYGVIVDLSGGGARITTPFEIESGGNILLVLNLENDVMSQQFMVVAHIIDAHRLYEVKEEKYELRVKFSIKEDKIREKIIRYIFEEERRACQKVKGN